MKTISGSELRDMIDSNEDLKIVEVLSKEAFEEFHLPNAINIPLGDNFEQEFQQRFPDKSQNIVVYCSNSECDASTKAASRLEEIGFRNIFDYEAGKDDWKTRGYALAS